MKIPKGLPIQPQARLEGQMRQAAEMYENHFLNQMVKSMRSTVNKESGWIKPNFGEQIFSEQLDQQYVDGWSKKGGIGLADLIYNHLSERYLQTGSGRPVKKIEALPLEPAERAKPLPTSDKSMSIRLEAAPSGEAGPRAHVVAPRPGSIENVEDLGDGWNKISLLHDNGDRSELVFVGTASSVSPGQSCEAGQKLGQLKGSAPVLDWKMNWT